MTRRKDLTSETAEDKFNVEAEARRRGIEPYQVRALTAVDDKLMADIVDDFYRRPVGNSGSMIPPSREPQPQRGNGWVNPRPMSPPKGWGWQTDEERKAAEEARIAQQQQHRMVWSRVRFSRFSPYGRLNRLNRVTLVQLNLN